MWCPTLLSRPVEHPCADCTFRVSKDTFQMRTRNTFPRETAVLMVWLYFEVIPAFKFLICKMLEGAWHRLSEFPGSNHEEYISLSNGLSNLREGKMHLSIWLSCLGLGAVPAISLLWYVCFYSLSSRIRSVERARSCILSRTSGDQMHPGALAYPFSLAWSVGDKSLFLDSWIILGPGIFVISKFLSIQLPDFYYSHTWASHTL